MARHHFISSFRLNHFLKKHSALGEETGGLGLVPEGTL